MLRPFVPQGIKRHKSSQVMGTAAPPATPPRPVRNTASWSGTAYSSGQARLISQLTLISGGRSPIPHLGTLRVGDGRPTAEVEAIWPRKVSAKMHNIKPQKMVILADSKAALQFLLFSCSIKNALRSYSGSQPVVRIQAIK